MEKINFCRTLFEETRFMSLLIKSTLSSIVARHGLNPYQAHLLGEIASQDGQTIKEFSALFEENPDAAELQQQVIEGFIAFRKLASLNSQLKIIPTDHHTRKEN